MRFIFAKRTNCNIPENNENNGKITKIATYCIENNEFGQIEVFGLGPAFFKTATVQTEYGSCS